MSKAEGHSGFTEEVLGGNIQVANMKNGHFSASSLELHSPSMGHGFVTVSLNKPQNIPERL